MSKFTSKKINFRLRDAYLYRDFIVMDEYQNYMKGQGWCVKYDNGKTLCTQKTKKDCIAWVDQYYQDMDDFTNSSVFINEQQK